LVLIGARDCGNLAEALIAAKARFPEAHIVVVGDSGQRDLVTTALTSGATSFIDQNVATSTLIKELELMAQGEPVNSVLILKRLLGNGSAPPSVEAVPTLEIDESQPPDTDEEARANPQLSPREAAILKALVQGAPNKIIAYRLNITEATVKVHVKAILRKIRVTNRTQAAIWAMHRQPLPKVVHADDGEVALTAA
jgi:two-component system nitrate/nitrite response regulator NarL